MVIDIKQETPTKWFLILTFLIAHITSYITLMPGDIVTTGTPPGVGLGMNPPVFLKDGDKMDLAVDNLGSQNIKVVAE